MQNYVSRFQLPNGKWAYVQAAGLIVPAQEHIARIHRIWKPPQYFFHLRPGGHVAALRGHDGNTWLGKIDLASFFYNVTRHRVTRSLKKIGYSFRDADEFAVASTVRAPSGRRRFVLPYGFVQSPLLASVSLDTSDLGNCFRDLEKGGFVVSVYVDDIIVSSKNEADVANGLARIREAAQRSNLPINEAKSHPPAKELRAFNIDLDAREMKIEGERYEQMCREVLEKGDSDASRGILSYVRSVSQTQADQMIANFPDAFPAVEPISRRACAQTKRGRKH